MMRKCVVFRQAGLKEIRTALEERLNASDAERLHLKFEDEGRLPAAAIVNIEGVELRLEKDYFDGLWTIATNEGTPRLLDRINENQLGAAMFSALQNSVAQLLG